MTSRTSRVLRSRPGILVGATLATSLVLGACGSDDDDDSEPAASTPVTTTATAPTSASTAATAASGDAGDAGEDGEEGEGGDYEIVSDAAVKTGYTDMLAAMARLSADPSTADEAALEEVHEMWESFEGTVKQNDPDTYLASEEALDSFLEAGADGDGAAMTAATEKMTTTSAAYLAAHPG